MYAEGWRRLWELTKWIAAIASGIWCVMEFTAAMPPPPDPASPAASQIAIGIFLVAVIGGGVAYSALHALEWVYRGFRPLPVNPKVKRQQTVAPDKPETTPTLALEQHPHSPLPHPDIQQTSEPRQRS